MAEGTREMRKLLTVLAAGVLGAFLVTVLFIGMWGPSGRYAIPAVLLEPQLLKTLNYNDFNPKTYENDRYVFDHLTFEKGEMSLAAYEQFYRVVEQDKSGAALEQFFSAPASLSIYVRTESPSQWQKDEKLFQTVEFSREGDYYRVQLHEDQKGVSWVYFTHPGILSKTLKIVSP